MCKKCFNVVSYHLRTNPYVAIYINKSDIQKFYILPEKYVYVCCTVFRTAIISLTYRVINRDRVLIARYEMNLNKPRGNIREVEV
jgi:hypothetical protein